MTMLDNLDTETLGMSALEAIVEIESEDDGRADGEQDLRAAMDGVCRKISPVWPLGNFVAVNPYLGFADRSLEAVADHMAKTVGARTTMPAGFYLQALDEGRITRADLAAALAAQPQPVKGGVEGLLQRARRRERQAGTPEGRGPHRGRRGR